MDRILTYTITPQEAGVQVLEFLRLKGIFPAYPDFHEAG